ncbi:hypothetical protein ACJ73_01872 [Blastomyces percursus]|uniref:Uncharacterized protein n=1 Tax=Blastomyces percursus TaxID=1658174 RepID=A0A1J9QF61_9EURO|nr:hypothetical protein ACJ73_01872 [Blastomyces percursus]
MNPFLNWAIVLVISGGLFWYYRLRSRPRVRVTPLKAPVEKHENGYLSKKAKRKAKRSPDNASSSGTPTSPAKPIVHSPAKQEVVSSVEAGDEGMDIQEFAKQLSKAKEGTSLSSVDSKANKNQVRTKEIISSAVEPTNKEITAKKDTAAKLGTPAEKDASVEQDATVEKDTTAEKDTTESSTCTSSTTGGDADDDMSPVNSPVVKPTVPVAGSVSDMLPPAPATIPVLRLVGASQKDEQSTKKNHKSEKITETKKQRQRRIKNENRKKMVEDAERARRIQLEKQLHTAREHERREAAKSKLLPATNAWKTENNSNKPNGLPQSTNTPPQSTSEPSSTPLLDTFEPTAEPSANPPPTSENTNPSSYLESWANNLPSEEEQMRIIMSESEWTTVCNRKKERRNGSMRAGSVSASETSNSDSQAVKAQRPSIKQPPPPPKTQTSATEAAKATTTTLFPPRQEPSNSKGHPLDSDWEP